MKSRLREYPQDSMTGESHVPSTDYVSVIQLLEAGITHSEGVINAEAPRFADILIAMISTFVLDR